MKLTIHDIHKRATRLSSQAYSNESSLSYELVSNAIKNKNAKDLLICIENWNTIPMNGSLEKLNIALSLFDELCTCGSEGQIRSAAFFIMEEAIPKNKSAKEMQSTLNRKLGQLKSKISTRVNNNVSNAIDTMNNASKSAKKNFKKNTARAASAVNKAKEKGKDIVNAAKKVAPKKEEAIIYYYEQFLEQATIMLHADRIMENYNRLSKRFNIDKVIAEETRRNGIYEATISLCQLVDTYSLSGKVKFNTVLETMWYGLNKHVDENFDKKAVINAATDYFIMKENGLSFCKSILESSMIYDADDMEDVEYILEEEPEENVVTESIESAKDKLMTYAYGKHNGVTEESVISTINQYAVLFKELAESSLLLGAFMDTHYEAYINYANPRVVNEFINGDSTNIPIGCFKYIDSTKKDETANAIREIINAVNNKMDSSIFEVIANMYPIDLPDGGISCKFSIDFQMKDPSYDPVRESYEKEYEKTNSFKKLVDEFKKKEEPNKENKLKNLIMKLYTKNVDNIVDETPNLLNYIRMVFVLGTVAINPVCGAVVAIADQFVRLHLQREETEKMLKALKAEQTKVEKKMESIDDPDQIDRLQKYSNALDEATNNVDNYLSSLKTDNELESEYNDDAEEDSFSSAFGIEKDDDDDDFDFNFDESVAIAISNMATVLESTNFDRLDSYNYQDFIQNNSNSSIILSIAEASSRIPSLIDPSVYNTHLDHNRNDLRRDIELSLYEKYTRISNISEAMDIYSKHIPEFKCKNIFDASRYVESVGLIVEALDCMSNAYDVNYPILETSFKNSLALASEKLKKSMQNLADKDRTISRNIDLTLSNMKKSAEKTLTNDNREAVIKGTILPSASKVLKMALASGAVAVLIDPVIAIVGMLGYLGCSKKYKNKEKQLILDEIDVELKMVQKYIDIAESKNDMKAMKKMLMAQKELERQKARIKYNMKMYAGKDIKDSSEYGND